MGHLIAAAGATETIVCLLAIRDNVLPPTINYHNPDPECDLDYIPNEAREAECNIALTNSFGFGGQNLIACQQGLHHNAQQSRRFTLNIGMCGETGHLIEHRRQDEFIFTPVRCTGF